jgi:hypothetical protein
VAPIRVSDSASVLGKDALVFMVSNGVAIIDQERTSVKFEGEAAGPRNLILVSFFQFCASPAFTLETSDSARRMRGRECSSAAPRHLSTREALRSS